VIKDKSGDEYKCCDLTFRIEPMTRELAAELDEAIKGTLYRRNDAEINGHLTKVEFTHKPKPQALTFRPDPALTMTSLELDESKITKLRARKPKDGNHWVFLFRATVAQLSGQDLLYLQEALYKQHFLTFEPAEPGLFDEEEKKERKVRRAAAGGEAHAH
jgi:hypothetical protein